MDYLIEEMRYGIKCQTYYAEQFFIFQESFRLKANRACQTDAKLLGISFLTQICFQVQAQIQMWGFDQIVLISFSMIAFAYYYSILKYSVQITNKEGIFKSNFIQFTKTVHEFEYQLVIQNDQQDSIWLQFKKYLKMSKTINTVSVYRSLLQEDDYEIKAVAIKQLLDNINLHWTDIANDINSIEKLLDDPNFHDRQLVALLLAKIYYYLNEYDEALNYALKAGKHFDISGQQQCDFTQILINKAIEKYINGRREKISDDEQKQYRKIVDVAIDNSIAKGDLKSPLGISLDTEDLDLFKRIAGLMSIHKVVEMVLPHLLRIDISFRKVMLDAVSERLSFKQRFTPYQYLNILQILYAKGDYESASRLIYECLKSNQKEVAYTLAFEVSEWHGFNLKVLSAMPIQTEMQEQRKIIEGLIDGQIADQIVNSVLKHLTKTDPHYQGILKKIQSKNSVSHGSAIMGLSFLQAFTQDDSFLQKQQNLAWAGKCTHWNKFSSIASLGMIFKNCKDKNILKKFLPGGDGNTSSHYQSGGALYGLGLLYIGTANQEIIQYVIDATTNPAHNQNQVIMHGACLGLGLTSFASGNETVGERLKDILNSSTSVMGEASALAIGLTFAGTNNESILSDLIAIAQDTEHEKTLRSICLSIGLISFGSPSLQFLQNLQNNQNLKWAVPLYIACTYFKSSNPTIVRKLLKLSNDISNQVKRTALIALGFVMYHDQKLIDIIKMLLYSYNPYIRYGCVLALAIGSRDNKQAIQLIWPLLTDSVDFVRQGVYISLAILLQVSTNNSEPRLDEFRKTIQQVLGKTHVQVMAKMGAILSIGLLDIGGRNMSISLTTRSGMPKLQAIAGMLIFCQYWNWFPYLNFISLALSPSVFIGITTKLQIPKDFQIKSNCRPSLFDYPANIVVEQKKVENIKQQAKELSTTNKTKARAALKKKQSEMEAQVPDSVIKRPSLISQKQADSAIRDESKPEQKEQKALQKKQEQTFSILNNPVRIAQKQRKFIKFLGGRYSPVLNDRIIGINFLYDSQPNEGGDFLNVFAKEEKKVEIGKPLTQIQQQKPQEVEENMPPEEFQYDQSKQLLDKKEQ